jgi:hypothetical protein
MVSFSNQLKVQDIAALFFEHAQIDACFTTHSQIYSICFMLKKNQLEKFSYFFYNAKKFLIKT